jgi:hypothetical protein
VTISQLSAPEKKAYDEWREDVDAYEKFVDWYKERHA